MTTNPRRVVITGIGLISPIGNNEAELWEHLSTGKSGVNHLTRVPSAVLPCDMGGEAKFTGQIVEFGSLEKGLQRSIKKGLKLMCREIEMGVAAAQLAIQNAGWTAETYPPDRIGTMFGCDYIASEPDEFLQGIKACITEDGFMFDRWGSHGMQQIEPLWLLKYLPNMPASHIAIYNDFRGPSNSVTLREASSNLTIAESVTTIRRNIADAIIVGATGTRIQSLRTIHVALQEKLAPKGIDPGKASRPFDRDRQGMVIGEGSGVLILEELEHAKARGATIYGEVTSYASSTVCSPTGEVDYQHVFENVIDLALERAGKAPEQLGHINAHGLSDHEVDAAEARAIHNRLGDRPVVAVKSYMGNLGAGSGMVEIIASLLALKNERLFPVLNLDNPDPACPINCVRDFTSHPGDSFINLNVSPQGQAAAIVIQRV
ncbi:MAG: beta-ketoacyl-[acyl-carrier-protein] synthase family protein [Pirellulaceae bacterium]|nr:beta-ketoacyl-[acyl-carrier-protein] synthase family protein [Pirellulaceae bacterium]